MKRPEKISVGARTYKIVIDPTLQLREGPTGQCDHQSYTISLLPRLRSCQLDEGFWHEVVHAIDCVFLNQQLQEPEVASLGAGLAQVISNMGISFEWEKSAILKANE